MKENLDEKLAHFQQRIENYLDKPQSLQPDTDSQKEDIREDLSTLAEELQVAIAELRQKNLELAQSRNQIEAERARYKELFEFAPDGYLVTDQMGIILEANEAVGTMLNTAPEYLMGKPLAMYVVEDERRSFRSWLSHLVRSTLLQYEPQKLVLRPRHAEPLEVSIVVGRSQAVNSSKNYSLRWMLHDISALELARREIEQARNELEDRVEQRTRELSKVNKELTEVNRRLENRNRELQEFAFIASHDLQEPLRKIKAFGEQISRKPLDDNGRDFLERMIDASTRMQVMLEGLLEYARVNYTGHPFMKCDLNTVVQEVSTDLEYRLLQTGGKVMVGDLPFIEADAQQMYRLFQNLIANGIKFHRPEAPPEIVITAVEDGDTVTLNFQDNGVGFDERFRERLFLPFSRLHGRSQFEGSGMGLAICRKIVERHSGRITAEGQPGEGAIFSVTLPKKQPA